MPTLEVRGERAAERTAVPMEVEPQGSGAVACAAGDMGVGEEATACREALRRWSAEVH